jgi:hypothetical protein
MDQTSSLKAAVLSGANEIISPREVVTRFASIHTRFFDSRDLDTIGVQCSAACKQEGLAAADPFETHLQAELIALDQQIQQGGIAGGAFDDRRNCLKISVRRSNCTTSPNALWRKLRRE